MGGLRLHRLATTPPDRVEPHHHPPRSRSASPPHLPSPAGRRPSSSSDSEDSISLLFNQSEIDLSDGQLIDEVLEEHERMGWRLSPVSPAATPPPPNIFHLDAIEPEVDQDPLSPLEVVSLVQRAPALSDTVLFGEISRRIVLNRRSAERLWIMIQMAVLSERTLALRLRQDGLTSIAADPSGATAYAILAATIDAAADRPQAPLP